MGDAMDKNKLEKKLKKVHASSVQSAMALERTRMANTRTMLAYIRSAVTLFVAGAGLLKFVSEIKWVYIVGILFIIATPVIFFIGMYEYINMRKRIDKHELDEWDIFHFEDDDEI